MSEMRRFLQDKDCVLAESLSDLNDLRRRYTVNGNPTPVNSPFGKALSLDIDTPDYVAADDATYRGDLIGTEDFSVALWVRTTNADIADDPILVCDKASSNGTNVGWAFLLSRLVLVGANGLHLRINDGSQVNDTYTGLTTNRISLLFDMNWHFVAVTCDRDGDATFYVDQYAGETDGVDDPLTLTNNQDLTIGCWGNKSIESGAPSIALRNLLIFKRVLTATEISNLASLSVF